VSCGFGEHVMVYSFYNSYDDVDVYECTKCGKVSSKKRRASTKKQDAAQSSNRAGDNSGALGCLIVGIVLMLVLVGCEKLLG
jgi:hypothetical protein